MPSSGLGVTRVGESREQHRDDEREHGADRNGRLDARRAQPCNLGSAPWTLSRFGHAASVENRSKKSLRATLTLLLGVGCTIGAHEKVATARVHARARRMRRGEATRIADAPRSARAAGPASEARAARACGIAGATSLRAPSGEQRARAGIRADRRPEQQPAPRSCPPPSAWSGASRDRPHPAPPSVTPTTLSSLPATAGSS